MGTSRNGSKPLSVAALAVIVGLVRSGFAAPPPSFDAAPSPPGSPGSEPDSVRSFSALRAQGNAAYKAGRVAEAVEAWTLAYAIRPSHAVACAIGRIEFLARGNALEGARWLTRCVNQAPLPDPSQPKEFTSQKEELELRDLARARVGAVRVVTDAGAMIEVDGREVGKGPLDDEVFLMPGAHRFRVLLGERSHLIEVTLAAGESRTVDLSLPVVQSPALSAAPPLPQAIPSSGAQEGSAKASNEALLRAGIAVGAVGLALSVGFGAAALKVRGEAEGAAEAFHNEHGYLPCTVSDHPACAIFRDTSDRADAFTVVSIVGLSAAVVGGVMTAYAIFKPRLGASGPGVQVAFIGAPGGGGLVLTRHF
jgi:hypothetical protein